MTYSLEGCCSIQLSYGRILIRRAAVNGVAAHTVVQQHSKRPSIEAKDTKVPAPCSIRSSSVTIENSSVPIIPASSRLVSTGPLPSGTLGNRSSDRRPRPPPSSRTYRTFARYLDALTSACPLWSISVDDPIIPPDLSRVSPASADSSPFTDNLAGFCAAGRERLSRRDLLQRVEPERFCYRTLRRPERRPPDTRRQLEPADVAWSVE